MNHQSSETKNLLILGGTSSVAEDIARLAYADNYRVILTFRAHKKNGDYGSWYELDTEREESIDNFLAEIQGIKFDRVICLIGATTNSHYSKLNLTSTISYYSSQLAGICYLISRILANLKFDASFIVLSSKSANNKSYDIHYSAVKAGLQAFVKSISQFAVAQQSILCIAPSLIDKSTMYFQMTKSNRVIHNKKANGKLLSKDEISNFIWNLDNKMCFTLNGRVIEIGRDF